MITIDNVTPALSKLTSETIQEIMLNAVKAGGDVLTEATRKKMQTLPYRITDKMIKGAHTIKDKDLRRAVVSIMGDYRLHWLEKGTKERVTKSGARRGRIPATRFFLQARTESEEAVINKILQSLDQQLNKINN